jgi:hypothetical protein
MRIGKSQRAYKNLTPEARKNHLGKNKIRLLETPFLIFRQKKSLKKKPFSQLGSNPFQPVASIGPQGSNVIFFQNQKKKKTLSYKTGK